MNFYQACMKSIAYGEEITDVCHVMIMRRHSALVVVTLKVIQKMPQEIDLDICQASNDAHRIESFYNLNIS